MVLYYKTRKIGGKAGLGRKINVQVWKYVGLEGNESMFSSKYLDDASKEGKQHLYTELKDQGHYTSSLS